MFKSDNDKWLMKIINKCTLDSSIFYACDHFLTNKNKIINVKIDLSKYPIIKSEKWLVHSKNLEKN